MFGINWKRVVYAIIISFFIAVVAFYSKDSTLKLLNLGAWVVTAYFLYGSLFRHVNNLDLSDDLTYWGMKIVGIIIGLIGFFMGSIFFFGGLAMNMDPVSMGVGTLLLGLGILGAFVEFRLKRRYGGIHVWR